MSKTMRRILLLLLPLVFLGSGAMLLRRLADYREGQQEYDEAGSMAGVPDFSDTELPPLVTGEDSASGAEPYVDPYADALAAMDFSALREVNPDVLGWILIPDTVVSYPLVQGTDNEYYLTRTWKKWTSAVGSIFLEASNHADFTDFNTVIYGHNMNNGSMFGTLKKYKSQSYYRQHPYVYLTTDSGSARYEIFAAYEVSTEGESYRLGFANAEEKQAFLDACLAMSVIDTGVTPTPYDHIITLSTCTGRGHATRWVVQARLAGEAPTEPAAPAQPESPAQPEEPVEPEAPAEPDSGDAAASGGEDAAISSPQEETEGDGAA